MITNDPFDLQRFVAAQDGIIEQAMVELREGHKRGHWMWFIFPQIRGLGSSSNAQFFGISCREEAAAYLRHPVLGMRLRECIHLIMQVDARPLRQILGTPDDLKFRSSMTLFAHASADNQLFTAALKKYCDCEFDRATLERL